MPYRHFRRAGQLLAPVMGSPDGPFNTSARQHAQDIANAYGSPVADITVIETTDPPDVTGGLPSPVTPATPDEIEREAAEGLRLPTLAEIDTLVDTIFSGLTAPQRAFLRRLAKLVRRLVEAHGL